MSTIIVIAHNLRSTHNVGSLLRTAEGLGIHEVIMTGYTPHPQQMNDDRLPHLSRKTHAQIIKTALGAEDSQLWAYQENVLQVIERLKLEGYIIAGLEQSPSSTSLPEYQAPAKIAVLLGSEVTGIHKTLLPYCDVVLEIPMFGTKESFNVVQAAAMTLYQLVFK
jgi:23S rRNA (guanosine2251-2'-O)-methyltransferase